MTDGDGTDLRERIAHRGREVVVARLREAFADQVAARRAGADLDPAQLEGLVQEAAANAGEALWRRSLAQAVMEELDIDLPAALAHPVLADAHALGAPEGVPPTPSPPAAAVEDPPALCLSVVHLSGIDTLQRGDDDLELRLSGAGLDVFRRSSATAIGRLEWSEISTVALPEPKRGLRRRQRARELHVSTGRGQALFALPGLTDEELHELLEPALARLTGPAAQADAAVHPRTDTPALDTRDSRADPAGSPAEAY